MSLLEWIPTSLPLSRHMNSSMVRLPAAKISEKRQTTNLLFDLFYASCYLLKLRIFIVLIFIIIFITYTVNLPQLFVFFLFVFLNGFVHTLHKILRHLQVHQSHYNPKFLKAWTLTFRFCRELWESRLSRWKQEREFNCCVDMNEWRAQMRRNFLLNLNLF